MAIYAYKCRTCGCYFEELERGDSLPCPDCGEKGIRIWSLINIDAKSARHRGHFDPQVGAYVESENQFKSLLRQGQEQQERELGMEVKLATVDARDKEGLAELHGIPPEVREADLELTKRANYDKARR